MATALDSPVLFTFFKDFGAREKDEEAFTLRAIAPRIRATTASEKGRLPWLKMATFGNVVSEKASLRHDANVLTVTGLEADYDGGSVTVDEAVETLEKQDVAALVYTSPSHTEDAPRWRVICPFSAPMEPHRREKMLGRLNGLFGGIFAGESFTLSQAYYYGSVRHNPSHRVELIDGTPIDEHDDLDEIWRGRPNTEPRQNGHDGPRSGAVDPASLFRELMDGTSYHTAAVRLAGHFARNDVAYMDARRLLRDAMLSVPDAGRDLRWRNRWDDLDRTLEDIYGKEAKKRDQQPEPEAPPTWFDEAPPFESVDTQADHASEPPPDEDPALSPFPASPITLDEWNDIPPRERVYGHFLYRKFISALGAPGGAGKTAYATGIAFAVATGRDILHERVYDSGAVWIYNLEDPRTELLRRVKATAIAHKIAFSEISGRLFLDSGRDRPLVIATTMRDNTVMAWPQVPALIAEIKARGVRLLIVDPFVRSHRVEENHNDQVDFVAALWAQVADKADCAVLLVHHFKKGGISGDSSAFRGASALIDASRAAVTLTTMSGEEAGKLAVEDKERWQYVRVDSAKLNLAPPPENAVWLHLRGIDLRNETVDREADNIQSVVRWSPPSVFAETTSAGLNEALDGIQGGPEPGILFTASRQGGSARWAGKVLMVKLGVTDKQAAAMIGTWLKSGLLIEQEYPHPGYRRPVRGVVVDNLKRPS